MAENNKVEQVVETNELGSVTVANDVIGIIAGLAATEVEGVAAMSGGIVGGIVEMLGRKNLNKGIKVVVANKVVTIDASLIVKYGMKIYDVCQNVQNKVIDRVESMTGMKVEAVNVNVLGLEFPKEEAVALPEE